MAKDTGTDLMRGRNYFMMECGTLIAKWASRLSKEGIASIVKNSSHLAAVRNNFKGCSMCVKAVCVELLRAFTSTLGPSVSYLLLSSSYQN